MLMHDPKFSSWPDPSLKRTVVRAEVEVADTIQGLYKLTIHDSAEKQHSVQLPSEVLHSVVESGAAVLGLSLSRQDS